MATALVAADGSYQLLVDPGRSYQLLAEPALGVALGRALLTKVMPLSGTTTLPAQTLPVVHPVHGMVSVTPNRVWMPGALIQAFCSTASAKCDPTFPLAEAITGQRRLVRSALARSDQLTLARFSAPSSGRW